MSEASPLHGPVLTNGARVRGLAAAISSITAVGVALGLSLPLLALLLEQRGVTSAWIGINSAVAGISAIGVTPFVTPLARRFGTARLTFAMTFLAALTFSFFYLIEDFWLWFPLRLVFHGSLAMVFVLSEFWINSLAPDSRRGLIMGIYATILSLGFVAGPLIFAAFDTLDYLPFAIGTGILALASFPALLARKSSPRLESSHNGPFFRFLLIAPMATMAGFVFGAVESGAMTLLPLYGLNIGLETTEAALLVSAFVGGNVMMQIPMGLLADRYERRQLLTLCAAVGFFGAFLIPVFSGSFAVLAPYLFLWGGIIAGMYTIGLTHLGSRFNGADLASANAAFVLMYATGMLAGPASMGAALDTGVPAALAWTLAGYFALYLFIAFWRMRAPEGR